MLSSGNLRSQFPATYLNVSNFVHCLTPGITIFSFLLAVKFQLIEHYWNIWGLLFASSVGARVGVIGWHNRLLKKLTLRDLVVLYLVWFFTFVLFNLLSRDLDFQIYSSCKIYNLHLEVIIIIESVILYL